MEPHPTTDQAEGAHSMGGYHPLAGHPHEATAHAAIRFGPVQSVDPDYGANDYHVPMNTGVPD